MSSHPTQVLVIVIFHRKRRNMINAIIQKGSVEGNGRFFFFLSTEEEKRHLTAPFLNGEMEI